MVRRRSDGFSSCCISHVLPLTQERSSTAGRNLDSCVACLHHRSLVHSRQTADAHNRRDKTLVFILRHDLRTGDLYEMGLQMDNPLLEHPVGSVHSSEHPQTGNSRPDIDAGTAECMVHPARYRIHVFVLAAWMLVPYSALLAVQRRRRKYA